jgi:hypothetical protein
VAHGVTALLRPAVRGRSRTLAVLPVPLLLLGGAEGVHDDWRLHPDQSVRVVRVLHLDAAAVPARLAAGPRPTRADAAALRLLHVPTPERVAGAGLAPGDRWTFRYPGSAHGPGGQIVAEVRDSGPGRVTFRVVEDTAITGRWLSWRDAEVTWRPVGADRTEVAVTLAYRRRLDPSWYFGPVQDRLMHAGGQHLLDMLALR